MSLTLSNTAGSLGDWLSLTPILNARPNSTVIAIDSPHTRQFARLYEGLANVEFTSGVLSPVGETDEATCFSQRILNYYRVTDALNAIPVVRLRPDEINWARTYLAPYPNAVAFNNTTAAADKSKPDTDLCNYRRLPDNLSKAIIANLRGAGHAVLRFGCKTTQSIYNNYDEFDGVVNLSDLNVRQLAACYHIIGRYAGSATGDLHLMLAVGGKVHVFVPPSCWHYDYRKHHYVDSAWGDEPIRAIYQPFERQAQNN